MTVDEYGRPESPTNAGETETLLGFLDFQRATFAWKSEGLDAAGFAATTAATTMTLGRLHKHLAYVEDLWFSQWLHGDDLAPRWNILGLDMHAHWDWVWASADEETGDGLRRMWRAAVERSREGVARALAADPSLDQTTAKAWPDGTSPSLRWVIVHMIEEYARHNGHADLLREAVDGKNSGE
ncbi:MAG TPA: DinB family protein [Frankiaceae bacterium]|nr:DinB family protein [Frankiaceae bacterium]